MATFLHKIFGDPDDDLSKSTGCYPVGGHTDHDDDDREHPDACNDDDDEHDEVPSEYDGELVPSEPAVILPPSTGSGETLGAYATANANFATSFHAVDVVGHHTVDAQVTHFGLPSPLSAHNHFTGIALRTFLGNAKKGVTLSDKELKKIVAASLRVGDAMIDGYFDVPPTK